MISSSICWFMVAALSITIKIFSGLISVWMI
jgi:hypothetical protein